MAKGRKRQVTHSLDLGRRSLELTEYVPHGTLDGLVNVVGTRVTGEVSGHVTLEVDSGMFGGYIRRALASKGGRSGVGRGAFTFVVRDRRETKIDKTGRPT